MASRQIFGLNLFAFVLVLFLRIEFNSSEELSRNEKTVILGKDITDPSHRSFSLIDSIRKSDPGNEWQIADNPNDVPWIHGSAVNPYIDNEKKREKRLIFLLPLLRGIATVRKAAAVSTTAEKAAAVATTAERAAAAARAATTAERAAAAARATTTAERAAAAAGIGAVGIANQQKYNRNSGISMSERKLKIMAENEPRRGQSTRGHMGTRPVPKSKGIITFRVFDEAKPNTPVQGGGGTSIIYMQAKKPKSTTEKKPRRGQSTPDHVGAIPVPKTEDITAFPGLKEAKPKTPIQGGGGSRARWKNKNGKIFEWDYKKGELEVYDKTGRNHEGGFDPYEYPPRRISKPKSTRRVEP